MLKWGGKKQECFVLFVSFFYKKECLLVVFLMFGAKKTKMCFHNGQCMTQTVKK